MIDISYAARICFVCDFFCGRNSADATGINLDKSDAAMMHQVPRAVQVVTAFARGEFHVATSRRQRGVLRQRAGMERFFKPQRPRFV